MTTAAHFLYRHQSRRGAQSVAMAAGCRKTMGRASAPCLEGHRGIVLPNPL